MTRRTTGWRSWAVAASLAAFGACPAQPAEQPDAGPDSGVIILLPPGDGGTGGLTSSTGGGTGGSHTSSATGTGTGSSGAGHGASSTGPGNGASSTGAGHSASSTGVGNGASSTGAGNGASSTGAGNGASSTGAGNGASSTGAGNGASSTGAGNGASSTGGSTGSTYNPGSPLPSAAQPIGVNLPDLLWAYLGQAPTDVAGAQAEMDAAVAHGFNFARFVASPFWPTGMTTGNGWVANPTAFWAAFDALVQDAHTRGLHLVPSLLWNYALFADVAGEPIGRLFTPGTTSRTLANSYVTAVVTRYAPDAAILFWEIGNELNLIADLDLAGCNVCDGGANSCGLEPSLGTPCFRSAADDVYSCNSCRGVTSAQEDLGQFEEDIGELIQGIDPSRSVSSGNGYPRTSAYHLSVSPCPACDWTADTEGQYQQALAQITPAAIGILSVHHYPGPDNERFGDDDPAGLALIAETQSLAQTLGKKLYVGEVGEASSAAPACGAPAGGCGGDPARTATEVALNGFVQNGVPYSSLWAFDFDQFCAGVPTCYTVQDTESDIVNSMAAHSAAFGACAGQPDGTACPIGNCNGQQCQPLSIASLTLDGTTSISAWLQWTNCSNCTPSTLTQQTGHIELAVNDLPCTGSCGYPGGYALTPYYAVQPGHALVRVDATSSANDSDCRVMGLDALGNELVGTAIPTSDGGYQTGSLWLPLPNEVTQIAVRFEVVSPNSTLDVRSISFQWEP